MHSRSSYRPWFLLSVAVVLLLLNPRSSQAQITTGQIHGRVTDDQGQPLPGVLVEARSLVTGLQRGITTDSKGEFTLLAMPPGEYEVRAEFDDFGSPRQAVIVRLGRTVSVSFTMMSNLTERITVTAEPQLLNTTKPEISTIITDQDIRSYPLLNRDFTDLAKFAPGAKVVPGGGDFDPTAVAGTRRPFTTGGSTGRNLNMSIDGIDNTGRDGWIVQGLPADAIKEYEIIQDQHKAEYGRSSGAVVNVLTKEGSNEFHGTLFGMFRGDNLRSESLSEEMAGSGKQESDREQYGLALGGPILQDRLFYHVAVERQNDETPVAVSPIVTQHAGTEPAGFPFSISSPGVSFLQDVERDLLSAKITWLLSADHRLEARYSSDRIDSFNGQGSPVTDLTNNLDVTLDVWSAALAWQWIIADMMINELKIGRQDQQFLLSPVSPDPALTLVFSEFSLGRNFGGPQTKDVEVSHLRDDFSWTAGRHSMKAGVELQAIRSTSTIFEETTVTFLFNPGVDPSSAMASGLASGLPGTDPNNGIDDGIDILAAVSISGHFINPPRRYSRYGVYLQDDWEITDRWRVHLGLRIDHEKDVWTEMERPLEAFYECMASPASNKACGRDPSTTNPPAGFEPYGRTFPKDPINVAPRLGFVYKVRGEEKDVLRGSWGLYYDNILDNILVFNRLNLCRDCSPVLAPLSGSSLTAGTVAVPGAPPLPNDLTLNNWINDPNLRTWVDQLTATQGPASLDQVNFGGFDAIVSPDYTAPYTSSFSVGWGHAFTPDLVLDTNLIYRRGFHQTRREVFAGRASGREAPWPAVTDPNTGTASYPGTLAVLTSDGKSEYVSLQLSVRARRERWNLGFNLNLSEATATQDAGGTGLFAADGGPVDIFDGGNIEFTGGDVDSEWGRVSGSQALHAFLFGSCRLPMEFSIAGELSYGTRVAVHGVTGGVDANGDGFPPFVFGNNEYVGGRGGGLGDDLFNIDLRFSKLFSTGKGTSIELFLDVFNLTDHDNSSVFVSHRQLTSVPGVGIRSNPAYLSPLGRTLTPPRTVQLGTRFSF